MRLIRILYQSQSTLAEAQQSALLAELVTKARDNNRMVGITGALVADDLWFVQVLEGAQKVVWATFERIRSDPRHRGVTILDVSDIEARSFADWSMTLALRTPQTERMFAAHGAATSFNPPRMTTGQLLNLLQALAKAGVSPKTV